MQRLEPDEIENQVFPLARRGYDKEKVDAFLRVVAAYYREAIRLAEPELVSAQPVVAPPQQPATAFGDVGEQIAAILSTAERAAEDLSRKAEREVQNMRRAAADEAAEITQSATNQLAMARQLKADAQQEAESLLFEARDQAVKLKQDAHAVAARLEQNARDRAARLEQAAGAKVSSILAEARRRYDILRTASHQSSVHLRSVEAMIRLAREELTGRGLPIDVDELSAENLTAEYDDGALPPAAAAPPPPERAAEPEPPEFAEPQFAEPEFPEPEFAEPEAELAEPEFAGAVFGEPEAAEPEAAPPEPAEPAAAPVENGAFTPGDSRTKELISDVLETEPEVEAPPAKPTRRRKPASDTKPRKGGASPRRTRTSDRSRSADEPG